MLWGHVKHHHALELIFSGGWWTLFTPQCSCFRLSANSEMLSCQKYLLPTAGMGPCAVGGETKWKLAACKACLCHHCVTCSGYRSWDKHPDKLIFYLFIFLSSWWGCCIKNPTRTGLARWTFSSPEGLTQNRSKSVGFLFYTLIQGTNRH